jgi:hypothetical protein
VGLIPRGFRHFGWADDHHVKYDYPVKKWFQVVGSYDGDSTRFYVDGVKLSTSPRKWNTGTDQFLVGKNLNANSLDYFNGSIDDIKIYDCILSDSFIKSTLSVHFAPEQYLVSPNPTRDIIEVSGASVVQLKLYNLNGSLIKQIDNASSMDVSEEATGIYYLAIRSKNAQVGIRKIIKLD